ncbi:unnamed protein product [Gadus morhua 'NCC']
MWNRSTSPNMKRIGRYHATLEIISAVAADHPPLGPTVEEQTKTTSDLRPFEALQCLQYTAGLRKTSDMDTHGENSSQSGAVAVRVEGTGGFMELGGDGASPGLGCWLSLSRW